MALSTAALSLVVAAIASNIAGALMRLAGIELATPGQVTIIGAVTSLLIAPLVIAPMIAFAFRWRALKDRLEAAALTDPLTGIPNRRAFFEHLAQQLGDEGEEQPFALMMVDVDHFKQLNDRFGHKAGDLALRFVAQRICDALARAGEPRALVARMGGEEFAVYLAGVGAGGAALAARAVCEGVRACAFAYDGVQLHLTVSIGVWSGRAAEVDGPLAQADRAAYAAKAAGRNRWMAAGTAAGLEPEPAAAA